ncbi:MAG: tetratricopeptide repeat protein [Bryobacteraceae bacterium]|nr:tetratricopeptide repeat protein [Bryobacteraceae bacterium]
MTILAAALVFLSLQTDARSQSKSRFEDGLRAQKAGDLATAIVSYREAIELEPKLTPAHYLLGVCLLQSRQMNEGIAALEDTLRLDARHLLAAQTLVSAYVATGRTEAAQGILKKHLALDRGAGTDFVRGLHALSTAEYAAAVRHFSNARRKDPNLPGAATRLGIAHCFTNNFEAAFPILEAAHRANPKDSNAAAFLGWLLKDRGRDSEAEPLLRQALEANPEDTGALFLLAQLSLARDDRAQALSQLEMVVRRDPQHRGAYVLLARLYSQLNRPADAARAKSIVDRSQ